MSKISLYTVTSLFLLLLNSTYASGNESSVSKENSYSFVVPAGFEDVLGDADTPTQLLYLNEVLDNGYFATLNSKEDAYKSSKGEILFFDKAYSCRGFTVLSEIVNNDKLCDNITFKLSKQNINQAQYVVLIPDDKYISIVSELLGIDVDNKINSDEELAHIEMSSLDTLSGRVSYNANIANNSSSNASLSLNSLVSYGEYLLEVQPTIKKSKKSDAVMINRFVGSKTYQGYQYEAGFKSLNESELLASNVGIIPNINTAGVWYSSTNRTLKNKRTGGGEPLQVFMPFAGIVEVYRNKRLLFVNKFNPGMNLIPVSDFPVGLYNVTIVRKSLDGTELQPITDTINNAVKDDGFLFSAGMMGDSEQHDGVFHDKYEKYYAGAGYRHRLGKFVSSDFSILRLDNSSYLQSSLAYRSQSPYFMQLFSEANLNSHDWGLRFLFSRSDTLWGKRVNSNFNYRYVDKALNKKSMYSVSFSLSPNTEIIDTMMLNYHLSDDLNKKSQYHELNFSANKRFNLFDLPMDLNLSVGNSTKDDINGTLSLSFNLDLNKSDRIASRYTYNKKSKSSYGEVLFTRNNNDDASLSSMELSVAGDKNSFRLGADAELDFDIANASIGAYGTYDAPINSYQSSNYARVVGNVFFSGDKFAFNNESSDAGIIIDVQSDHHDELEIFADISNGSSRQLKKKRNLVPLAVFSESSIYFNSFNSVMDENKYSYTLYKGNFSYLEILPRLTFQVAGFINFRDFSGDALTLKNHESKITIKNHESQASLKGDENNIDDFFELTVSRRFPVLDIISGDGEHLCTVDLEKPFSEYDNSGFMYLGKVGC